MTAETLQLLLQAFAVVGGVSAALWAIHNYRAKGRADAARWMKELHTEFYTDPDLLRGRDLFDYDYDLELRRMFEIRVASRHVELDAHQRENMRLVDRVLNFFEQIVYLEKQGHFKAADRRVFFDYWFNILTDEQKPALRRFVARTGYEHLAEALRFSQDDYVVFYGTLMMRYGKHRDLGIEELIEYVGPCVAPGTLVDLGEWPGAIQGDGKIRGELWRIHDFRLFRALDAFERFDPARPDESYYERTVVRLNSPTAVDAWIYYLREPPEQAPPIPHGDWAQYEESRSVTSPSVRQAVEGDVESIWALLEEFDAGITLTVGLLREAVNARTAPVFVAEHGGQIVGAAVGQVEDRNFATLRIKSIAVGPAFRRSGVSDRLLDRIAEWARLNGIRSIESTSHDATAGARKSLERLGVRLGSPLAEITGSDEALDGTRQNPILRIAWVGMPGTRNTETP